MSFCWRVIAPADVFLTAVQIYITLIFSKLCFYSNIFKIIQNNWGFFIMSWWSWFLKIFSNLSNQWPVVWLAKCLFANSLFDKMFHGQNVLLRNCLIMNYLIDELSYILIIIQLYNCLDELSNWRFVLLRNCLLKICRIDKVPNQQIVLLTNCLSDKLSHWQIVSLTKWLWQID